MTIVLITNVSCFDKAMSQVLELLLDSELVTWPLQGLSVYQSSRFSNCCEFWIMPEARNNLVLRFGDCDREATFRSPDLQTWKWYLSATYPQARVRLLSNVRTISEILNDERSESCSNSPAFSLSFLQCLFHDMRNWKDQQNCRLAAIWLSALNQPILFPFDFLQHERFWQRWRSRPEWRRTVTTILNSSQETDSTRLKLFPQVWMEICLKYQTWSTGGISETERVHLNHLMKLWKEKIVL